MEIIKILNFIIVLIITFIGLLVTIIDLRENRIKNKHIKWGLYIGLVYYIILFLITILNRFEIIAIDNYLTSEYYFKVLVNTLIAFVLAFILWNFKLWAGGDAKLFTLYVFLIPLSFYQNSYLPAFPAFNLLINIIIPIFIYLLIKMLIYPIGLLINYLKNPKLLKEYFIKHNANNKFSQAKLKEYLNTGLSFLLILIFFQLLRNKVNEFLNPYFGNLVYASYFFMGFVIFKPLRAFLKERVLMVLIAVLIYFGIGYFYFYEKIFADLHKIFAFQMIFMMSYFYIFKYGRALGQFLYNSAEVKMIPVESIDQGIFINKNFIKQIMGSRVDLNSLKKELKEKLANEDWQLLESLINRKTKSEDDKQKESIDILKNLRLKSMPNLISKGLSYKWQKDADKALLTRINKRLDDNLQNDLDNILKQTNNMDKFLKSIKGRLTKEQAEKLKNMIEERNKEIKQKKLSPINEIILHKTFSFAPFMLLGVIITLLTKTNLIHLIYEYILHR